MSEFVKRTALGYKAVPGGYPDPECSHVILTKQEYDQIMREKAQAEQEKRSAQYDAERAVKKTREEALRHARAAEERARQGIEAIERELAAEQAESEYQRRLNANLLRISKERANADRNLKPKKEHTGYVVVSSSEKEHHYRDKYKHWKAEMLWETALQSPYSVDFTEEQARKQMLEELFREEENGCWLIQTIGITGNYNGGYGEMIEDAAWQEVYQQHNVMLDRHLRANFRSGYWEIVFLHTKALGVIPKDMRAR